MNIIKEIPYRGGKVKFFESFSGTVVENQRTVKEYSSSFSGDTVAVIDGKEYAERGHSVSYTDDVSTVFAKDAQGLEESFKIVNGIAFREGNKLRSISMIVENKRGEDCRPVQDAIIVNQTLNSFEDSTSAREIHWKVGEKDTSNAAGWLAFFSFFGGLIYFFMTTSSPTLINMTPFVIAIVSFMWRKKFEAKVESDKKALKDEIYRFGAELAKK